MQLIAILSRIGVILYNGGVVEFKLRGSDLYGSLKNYGKVKSKSGKILKI